VDVSSQAGPSTETYGDANKVDEVDEVTEVGADGIGAEPPPFAEVAAVSASAVSAPIAGGELEGSIEEFAGQQSSDEAMEDPPAHPAPRQATQRIQDAKVEAAEPKKKGGFLKIIFVSLFILVATAAGAAFLLPIPQLKDVMNKLKLPPQAQTEILKLRGEKPPPPPEGQPQPPK